MITQKQIKARDEYICAIRNKIGDESFDYMYDAIQDADHETAEMQSSNDQKLALWDDMKDFVFRYNCHACENCIIGGDCKNCETKNLIKRIEEIK